MGQFTTRPEEPAEWAGLPSEPLTSRSEVEALAEPVESADSLGFLDRGVESVVIPVVVPPAEAGDAASTAQLDTPGDGA